MSKHSTPVTHFILGSWYGSEVIYIRLLLSRPHSQVIRFRQLIFSWNNHSPRIKTSVGISETPPKWLKTGSTLEASLMALNSVINRQKKCPYGFLSLWRHPSGQPLAVTRHLCSFPLHHYIISAPRNLLFVFHSYCVFPEVIVLSFITYYCVIYTLLFCLLKNLYIFLYNLWWCNMIWWTAILFNFLCFLLYKSKVLRSRLFLPWVITNIVSVLCSG